MITFDGTFTQSDLVATFHGLGSDVYFLQVGAMDGVAYDPIQQYVKTLGWKGILFEPIPDMYAKLKENYRSCSGLTFINTAIADYEGSIEMMRITQEGLRRGNVSKAALGLSSFMMDRGVLGNPTRVDELKQALDRVKEPITVSCTRLLPVLKEHDVRRIDLMVVDTEGADWMVVRQLPLDEYRPRIVYMEYCHLSGYEQLACAMHFRNHGYRIYLEQPETENFMAIDQKA